MKKVFKRPLATLYFESVDATDHFAQGACKNLPNAVKSAVIWVTLAGRPEVRGLFGDKERPKCLVVDRRTRLVQYTIIRVGNDVHSEYGENSEAASFKNLRPLRRVR